MITDPRGRMVVGQFGAYINEMMRDWDRGIYPGDVILTSDPYKCSASISHTNDWLVLVPIFFEDELVGWSSQFGHQMDAGGRLPGSLPTGATTIFEEGLIIPPIKIVERGEVQEDVLRLILNNVRLPEMNRADLFAIVAGCRAGERRVIGLCERFGKDVVPRRAAGAARPHARGDADADRARDPGGAADVRGLDRRRRPRQRPVPDAADDLARGRPGLVRLDGHGPAGDRPDELLPLRGDVQDVHRGLPDHGQRPPDPLQRRLLSAAARRDAGGDAAAARTIPRRSAAARTGSRGCSTCSAARCPSRRRSSTPPRATAPRRTCSTGAGTTTASSSTRWRSSTAASPAGRSATAWTATRGGRCSRTSRPSTSRPTIRCASTATRRSPTPAAPGLHRGGNGVEKRYVYLEPGPGLDPRRPLAHAAVGRPRRRAGRALDEAPAPRRRHRGGAAGQVRRGRGRSPATCSSSAPRAAAAGRTASTGRSRPSRATWRSGSCRARRRAAGYGVVLGDDGTVDARRPTPSATRQRDRARRGARLRLRPAARGDARGVRGRDRAAGAVAGASRCAGRRSRTPEAAGAGARAWAPTGGGAATR